MQQLILTVLVVLGLPKRNQDLIAYVQAIILKMTGNANFPTPSPSLATVSAALASFQSSQTGTKTTKGDRTAKKKALRVLLGHLGDYVQGICEANIDTAAAIAESAGMRLRNYTVRTKLLISVKQGLLLPSGSVTCKAKSAAKDATYYWFYSLDQKTWTSVPEQMQTTITISGLTPGQTYWFRYRALTRKGMGEYSQSFSLLVK